MQASFLVCLSLPSWTNQAVKERKRIRQVMLVPPTAIVQSRHMEVTPVTAIAANSILTFRKDAQVLPACFSPKHQHI
jgi:hypothetical protein